MSDVLSFEEERKIIDTKIVFGYVRLIEITLTDAHIPVDIVNLCNKYYHVPMDRFDPNLHCKSILAKDTTASVTAGDDVCDGSWCHSAFLSNISNFGQHHWSFRINARDPDSYIYIGIWNDDELDSSKHCDGRLQLYEKDGKYPYSGVNLTYGELRGDGVDENKYCDIIKTGDIFHMWLDFEIGELSFGINDAQYGKAFDIESGSYRAVVSFDIDFEDQQVEILQYE